MWRTILLGKLGVSIAASILLGGICLSQPWRGNYSLSETARWIGVGTFFLLLFAGQVAAVFFLFRKKPFSGD